MSTPESEVKFVELELVEQETKALQTIGGNHAELVTNLLDLKTRLPALVDYAKTAIIKDQADYEKVAETRKELKGISKTADEQLDDIVGIAHKVHKSWTAFRGLFKNPADAADALLAQKQAEYIRRQEQLAAEEQAKRDREAAEKERKLREEQERLAKIQRDKEEAARVEAERIRRQQEELIAQQQRAIAEEKAARLAAEEAERRAQAEAKRQAEAAKNAKERERLQKIEAERAQAALAEQQKRQREEQERARLAKIESDRLAKEQADAEKTAREAAAKAEAREQKAADVRVEAPIVVADTPKVKGQSDRRGEDVDTVDLEVFLKAVAVDRQLWGYVEVDKAALKKTRNANPYFAPPGVKFKSTITIASRSK